MKIICKCGNELNNRDTPNKVEYHLYSDEEWALLEKKETIDFLRVPYPKYEVWHCCKCDRFYFIRNMKIVKVYKREE